jgi:hypothetical protein
MTDKSRGSVLGVGLALLMAGCESPVSPSFSGEGAVVLRIAAAGSSGGSTAAAPDTVRLHGDVLVLSSVELVLRRIELDPVGDRDCGDSRSSGGHGRDDDDGCGKIAIGPVLVRLWPGAGRAHVVRVRVPVGAYEEIEFEVHKPDDDTPEDRAFLQVHPDLRRVSIRVRGTFNGQPFTWVTDLNEEQEVEFSTPFVVEAGVETELVLMVDVRGWFQVGGRLVDPVTALKGQVNEQVVRNNVRLSVRAFKTGG